MRGIVQRSRRNTMLLGGCFCGAIRYAADGKTFYETNCHCTICRRTTGAPFVAWFTVLRTQFRFTQGEPTAFESSPGCSRSFCSGCGSQLTFLTGSAPDEIDVTIATLDSPEALRPRDHIFTSSQLPWIELADSLPRYPRRRSSSADE
jgi:hypothetical protein